MIFPNPQNYKIPNPKKISSISRFSPKKLCPVSSRGSHPIEPPAVESRPCHQQRHLKYSKEGHLRLEAWGASSSHSTRVTVSHLWKERQTHTNNNARSHTVAFHKIAQKVAAWVRSRSPPSAHGCLAPSIAAHRREPLRRRNPLRRRRRHRRRRLTSPRHTGCPAVMAAARRC